MAYQPATGICQGYTDSMSRYDEMCSRDSGIKQHWQYLVEALQLLGSEELKMRSQEAQRQLHQTGVTFDIHHNFNSQSRPLQLDPIPYVIDTNEWTHIEAGLIQRAELFNFILKDIYGPRTLVKNGLLPAELVFAHQGFLRACAGLNGNHAHRLIYYAVDLARSDDGQIWILSDRTQSPTGAGYALENRMVMRRIFPNLFRDSQVQRLAGFFRSFRNELLTLSPGSKPTRTVLLTCGTQAENYFEHSYLANYLGVTLAQGDDLTVRNGKVWLKSLDGLKKVDVIIRRIEDHLCDPLELNHASCQGVPGLLESVRSGQVTLANPFGSSILENPALQAYLPEICRSVMGQELILPGINTWWCGEKTALDYVVNNFNDLIIKPISKQQNIDSFMPSELSPKLREQMLSRLLAQPHLYAAQTRIQYATTPTLVDGHFQASPTIQRTFITARDNNYVVMPGGMSVVVSNPNCWNSDNDATLISKDIWILGAEPERLDTLWNNIEPADDFSETGSLPSRAAENFFWLGRLAERAESFIRLFRSILLKIDEIAEYNNDTDKDCLNGLIESLFQLSGIPIKDTPFDNGTSQINLEHELLKILLEPNNVGSLYGFISNMISSAYNIRDLISPDTWRVFSKLEDVLENWQNHAPSTLSETSDELDELIIHLAAFSGLIVESTTVDQGWLFLNIGRRLERAINLTLLIQTSLYKPQSESIEYALLQSLLMSTESIMTYHRRHRSNLNIHHVLEMLLMDKANPRSLIYQFEHLKQTVCDLPTDIDSTTKKELYLLEAFSVLSHVEIEKLCQIDTKKIKRSNLKKNLTKLNQLMQSTAQVISDNYFSHVAEQQLI
jgi:uncharacterized circularly permuted ATP-grasp superfamily protein/uncharacterized alpha-E superfamily protein